MIQRPRPFHRGPLSILHVPLLLFAATAIRAAAAEHLREVQLLESGQLSVHPPLGRGRSSGFSTRSVHPWTLHLLNRIIRAIAGDVTVRNPLDHATKAEVCKQAQTAGLSSTTLAATLSCSAPPLRRKGGDRINCGTCFPCLVRRVGLLAGTGMDRTKELVSEPHRRTGEERTSRSAHAQIPAPAEAGRGCRFGLAGDRGP